MSVGLSKSRGMNYCIGRARRLCHYRCTRLSGLGLFNTQKWQPCLQPLVFGRRPILAKCYKTIDKSIRLTCLINQPFCTFAKRNAHPFVNDGQNRLYSKEVSFQNLQSRTKRGVFYTSLKVLKVLCLLMGVSTWIVLALVLLLGDGLKFREEQIIEAIPSNYWAIVRKYKFLGILDSEGLLIPPVQDDDEKEEVTDEVLDKIAGFFGILERILSDERVQTSLGSSVETCGYNCSGNICNGFPYSIEKSREKTKWVASCYIEGSDGMAVLHILLEKYSAHKWVATKLHLQKIEDSGDVLCNLSSSLPNGLAHFTRLSDVKDLPE